MDADETLVGSGGAKRPAEPSDVEVPRRVGRYVILEHVGAGAMGEVFAAYDPELDRKVAVKLLHRARSNEKARLRMVREAQTLARLTHPNVVAVHDVGTYEGRVFMAMEFVEGTTLGEWLSELPRGPKRWRAILDVFVDAGRGLAAAHGAGIVHRDFKPDNVLVSPTGRAQVADFGVAARPAGETSDDVGRSPSGDLHLTDPGGLVGTPAYMSPEQFEARPTEPASDQFSFCVTLYESLFEQSPYGGGTPAERMLQVVEQEAREPPAGSDVPAWVRRIVMRGLAREPQRRWPSMGALLDALGRDPQRRRRRLAVYVAVGGLMAAVGGAVTWGVGDSVRCTGSDALATELWSADRMVAVRRAFEATDLVYAGDVAQRVTDRLGTYAEQWASMHEAACESHASGRVSDALYDRRIACLDRRRQELEALVGVLASADADVVRNAVSAADGLGQLETCEDADALELAYDPPGPDVAEEVSAQRLALVEIRTLIRAGRFRDALPMAQAVSGRARELGYGPLQVEAWLELGRIQMAQGHYEDARVALDEAWHVALSTGYDLAAVEVGVVMVDLLGFRTREADASHLRAEDTAALIERIRRRKPGTVAILESRLLEARALTLLRERDFDGAEVLLKRSLEIVIAARGADSLDTARALRRLGHNETARRRFAQANVYVERALELLRRHLGPEHPEVAVTLNNLALNLKNQRSFDRAVEVFEEAADISERQLGPRHHTTAMILANLANTYRLAKQHDRAVEIYSRWQRSIPPGDSPNPADLANFASSLSDLGQLEQARAVMKRALESAKMKGDEAAGRTYLSAAHFEAAAGDHERALEYLARSREGIERAGLDAVYISYIELSEAKSRWALDRPGDRAAAIAAARRAALVLERSTGETSAQRDNVDAWLAEHDPPKGE